VTALCARKSYRGYIRRTPFPFLGKRGGLASRMDGVFEVGLGLFRLVPVGFLGIFFLIFWEGLDL